MRISSLSLEYVKVGVTATVASVPIDPTGDQVALAFTAQRTEPEEEDWHVGDWETIDGVDHARCLVGPGSTIGELEEGDYWVWVRITDNPERPVLRAGTIRVT